MDPLHDRSTASARVILLADHDTDTRAMYAEALSLAGWRVDEAADGREALAKAITRRPALLVTETRLPFVDGLTLCGLLRRDGATRALPIIVLTADPQQALLASAPMAGPDLVLAKPCLPDRLQAEIARLMDRLAGAGSASAGDPPESPPSPRPQAPGAQQRRFMARSHQRYETRTPPAPPPALRCPRCDRPLEYQSSHVGGVSARHPEQWDYFVCPGSCGRFQYRQRTRRLRRIT